MNINTVEMHTGGEPLRIITDGFPKPDGKTILQKRRFVKEKLDNFRKLLMHEPRGHYDMYGALLVEPDIKDADIAALFIHNEGYSTMCGHAVIALGRYAIDYGHVTPTEPETKVNIECPCGLVRALVEYKNGKSGSVRFQSVPAFVFATDVELNVQGHGKVKVDISYGGAFYAFISADKLGLDLWKTPINQIKDAATMVTNAVKNEVQLEHPDDNDLAFIYGTIVTDGKDEYSDEPTANICVFADAQVDRSPTGSGVTARTALQYHKRHISLNKSRVFVNARIGSKFSAKPVRQTKCGSYDAVIIEVSGHAFYTGKSAFTFEEDDPLKGGFLLK
ncbi:trans-L-3-hydroxyproline dehydratase [Saccoglossus kowalevskii]|uniref:trans-L-3-hydroxyproline dehydratase n=1 Tax=Saccoglossus kowalevskii TaxID=10224 RepID=A0A1B1JCG8_SACKO|nr:PREDICTED: trans-L-3-hydroxyproline dehydratase isoform X2 [Saccoglossus kowalevskii]ANS11603.1 trans-L-3-hydroxyproline dehydratase-like protein [Saccoglossus kowalevskii]